MRKYGILTGVLLAFAVAVLLFTHGWLNPQKDDMTVTETVLTGDRAKAIGTTFDVEVAEEDLSLYWTTTSEIVDEGLKTQTAFSFQRIKAQLYIANEASKKDDRITLEPDINYGGSGSDGSINLEYTARDHHIPLVMAQDAADATAAGEKKTSLLYLKDYNLSFPMELSYDSGLQRMYNTDATLVDYSYFNIPAPDDMRYAIEIEKNSQGEVRSLCSEPVEHENYTIDSDGVIVDETLYMAVTSVSAGEYYPEHMVAHIAPEQRGIHAIPLKQNGEMRHMDLDHAKTVFRLDKEERILRMVYREDEDAFHLYTEDQGKLWFSIVEKETMTRKVKLYLMDKKSPLLRTYFYDDFSVILDGKGNFVLTSKGENPIQGNIMTLDLMKHYVESMQMETLAWAYDGTRLAVAAVQLDADGTRESNCLLQIFEKNGLQYAGLYENSLEGDELNRNLYPDLLLQPVDVHFVH